MKRRRFLQVATLGGVGGLRIEGDRRTGHGLVGQPRGLGQSVAPDRFDPDRHGFGFRNWAGATGHDAHGQEFTYEPADVTVQEVRQAIEDSWTTALSDVANDLLALIVHSWIGGNAATNGHCYGMVQAADEYFHEPAELPDSVDTASEIPRPTDEFDEVGDRIRETQSSQLLRAEVYWFGLFGLRWGLGSRRESLATLIDTLETNGTGGLILDGELNAHVVLAHGYESKNGRTDVFIYDPNYQAEDHEDTEDVWVLSVDQETGDVLAIAEGFDDFLFHDPVMDVPTVDPLIGDREAVLEALENAVFLGLEAGGTIDIDVPADVIVDRPTAEYADPDRAPYADAALVLGSIEEFEIAIDGDAGQEFTLETFGVRDGNRVLEDSLSNTLEDGEAQLRLHFNDVGDFVIEAVEGVEETTEEAGEEATDGWLEDGWWLPAAGGALGLGAAFWYYVNRSDEL